VQKRQKEEIIRAAIRFKSKPRDGIAYLVKIGRCDESPESIAAMFHELQDVLDKTQIGDFMGGETDLNIKVGPMAVCCRCRAVLSCPLLSSPVLSCPLLSSPVLSCPLLSCPVVSCRVLSSHSSGGGRGSRAGAMVSPLRSLLTVTVDDTVCR
jgi:hypothetical protein